MTENTTPSQPLAELRLVSCQIAEMVLRGGFGLDTQVTVRYEARPGDAHGKFLLTVQAAPLAPGPEQEMSALDLRALATALRRYLEGGTGSIDRDDVRTFLALIEQTASEPPVSDLGGIWLTELHENVLHVGGPLAWVILEQNASTGYSWTFKPDGSGIYRLVERIHLGQSVPGMVGLPSRVMWLFKAVKPGTGTATFALARGSQPPTEQIFFKMQVT